MGVVRHGLKEVKIQEVSLESEGDTFIFCHISTDPACFFQDQVIELKLPYLCGEFKLGVPYLTSLCMSIYFNIYTFSGLLLILRSFFSACVTIAKNMIYDIFAFDPFIFINIPSQLVPKIPRHAPVHSARSHPIGSIRPSLHHLQISYRRFHQKRTSL